MVFCVVRGCVVRPQGVCLVGGTWRYAWAGNWNPGVRKGKRREKSPLAIEIPHFRVSPLTVTDPLGPNHATTQPHRAHVVHRRTTQSPSSHLFAYDVRGALGGPRTTSSGCLANPPRGPSWSAWHDVPRSPRGHPRGATPGTSSVGGDDVWRIGRFSSTRQSSRRFCGSSALRLAGPLVLAGMSEESGEEERLRVPRARLGGPRRESR